MKPLNKSDTLKVKQSKEAYNYVQGLKDEIKAKDDLIKEMIDYLDERFITTSRINDENPTPDEYKIWNQVACEYLNTRNLFADKIKKVRGEL